MRRKRDSYRSRVYAAERAAGLNYEGEPMTEAEARAYLKRVCRSPWLLKQWPKFSRWFVAVSHHAPRLKMQNRSRGGGWANANELRLHSAAARQKWLILHELAHTIDRRNGVRAEGFEGHGLPWRLIYLDLLRHFLGRDIADRLKAELRKRGVACRRPAQRMLGSARPMPRVDYERLAAGRRTAAINRLFRFGAVPSLMRSRAAFGDGGAGWMPDGIEPDRFDKLIDLLRESPAAARWTGSVVGWLVPVDG